MAQMMRISSSSFCRSSTTFILFLLGIPLAAAADAKSTPPWDDLASNLGDPSVLQEANVEDWMKQCVRPFADRAVDDKYSNYPLIGEPSGLCMDAVFCAYKDCVPATNYDPWESGLFRIPGISLTAYQSSEISDDFFQKNSMLNLPDAVIHPENVKDVSEAIKFAAAHSIGISVKSTGHSYTGASTRKDTLLINMSNFMKFSPHGSIVECDEFSDTRGAYADACVLAHARDKKAVIRVGGGELFDEVLRAVFMTWNENDNKGNKYHIVTGGSGTVGAAGGWLQSGGLGTNSGTRLYGMGVDQVLHLEMVLPNGRHVRFGPTDWEDKDGMLYPQTTKVTGYCNEGDLSNEKYWDWTECKKKIDFSSLWYAVRGGGGGSYGVVTAVYYQLHASMNPYERAHFPIKYLYFGLKESDGDEAANDFLQKWIQFLLKFMYDPESIGVSIKASNSCGSNDTGGFGNGSFQCYNGAGAIMINGWRKEVPEIADDVFEQLFYVEYHPSFAHYAVDNGKSNPNVPDGRVNDEVPPQMYPDHVNNPDTNYFIIPRDALVNKRDEIVSFLSEGIPGAWEVSTSDYRIYQAGGYSTSDGMDAYPRRHAGFYIWLLSSQTKTKLLQMFYGVSDGEAYTGNGNLPSYIDHQHSGMLESTPLKSDWTQLCPHTWSKEEKEEKCYSYAESAWGTNVLKKLQTIHDYIDPYHLFDTVDGVGYTKKAKKNKKGKGVKDSKKAKSSKSKISKQGKSGKAL